MIIPENKKIYSIYWDYSSNKIHFSVFDEINHEVCMPVSYVRPQIRKLLNLKENNDRDAKIDYQLMDIANKESNNNIKLILKASFDNLAGVINEVNK